MGRKIPGRKHRGVRDLDKQRQERLDKLKDKVNAPPIDINDQEIPKSLTRLMELRAKVKSGEIGGKSKKPKAPAKYTKNRPVYFKPAKAGLDNNTGPAYIQESGESDRNFILRVNKVVQEVIKEKAFEEKYKVNIKRNQDSGDVEEVVKQDKDPLEMFAAQLKKEQKMTGKKKKKKAKEQKDNEANPMSKTQKKMQKQKLKKELKDKDMVEDMVEVQHEHVGFGEVAHEPPTLTAPRRGESNMCAARPGAKDLLLKNVIKNNQATKQAHTAQISPKNSSRNLPKNSPKKKNIKVPPKVINKQGKRKDLPVALRRQLDKQQVEIIKAYKELKKQKYIK